MSLKLTIFLFSSFLMFASCSAGTTQSTANRSQTAVESSTPISASASPTNQQGIPLATADAAAKRRVNACALLTSKEIEAVQGEAVKETKLSGQSAGAFSLSQCFFTLPTFTNSVSLQVTQMGEGAGAKHPKDFWRDTFHEERRTEKNNDRDKMRGEEEEEKEQTRPQKVMDIGDEAYWTGSRVGGALHVLKGNSYIRIGLGGPSDQATKIKKSKALAEKVIARL